MEKVSVIMPTFNRADKIDNIIEKIIRQTYSDFEFIIVNDGSSDNTEDVLKNWAEKDSRIYIINKTNGGLSDARNSGIEKATGKYIFFIDDDDDIPLNYIASFMKEEYEDIDLIIDSYSNQLDNNPPVPKNFPSSYSKGKSDILDNLFKIANNAYPFFAYGKRYKNSIIKNNILRFSTKITFVEDRIFVLDYIRTDNFETCRILNNHLYIIKEDSSSKYRLSQGHKPIDYLLSNFKDTYNYLMELVKEAEKPNIKTYADNYLAEKIHDYILIPLSKKCDKNEKKLLSSQGRELLKRVDFANVKKRYRLSSKCLLILGPSFTLFVIKSKLRTTKLIKKIIVR